MVVLRRVLQTSRVRELSGTLVQQRATPPSLTRPVNLAARLSAASYRAEPRGAAEALGLPCPVR